MENEQLLLPAPSAASFPEDMDLALLAVFWDDADLTLGNGQLFYQVNWHQSWQNLTNRIS